MTEVEYISERLQEQVTPFTKELLEHNCEECAIDKVLEVAILGIKQMRADYRQKLFASLAINFNLETGEEHGPLQT